MRRDYFTLDVDADPGAGAKPVVTIEFIGPEGQFEDRLVDESGATLDSKRIDVSYRLHEGKMTPEATGVFAMTNRITGDYVFEVNVDGDAVLDLVHAAREYGKAAEVDDDDRYQIVITGGDRRIVSYDKSTFLVYDPDGELLRQHSLIPSGVEL